MSSDTQPKEASGNCDAAVEWQLVAQHDRLAVAYEAFEGIQVANEADVLKRLAAVEEELRGVQDVLQVLDVSAMHRFYHAYKRVAVCYCEALCRRIVELRGEVAGSGEHQGAAEDAEEGSEQHAVMPDFASNEKLDRVKEVLRRIVMDLYTSLYPHLYGGEELRWSGSIPLPSGDNEDASPPAPPQLERQNTVLQLDETLRAKLLKSMRGYLDDIVKISVDLDFLAIADDFLAKYKRYLRACLDLLEWFITQRLGVLDSKIEPQPSVPHESLKWMFQVVHRVGAMTLPSYKRPPPPDGRISDESRNPGATSATPSRRCSGSADANEEVPADPQQRRSDASRSTTPQRSTTPIGNRGSSTPVPQGPARTTTPARVSMAQRTYTPAPNRTVTPQRLATPQRVVQQPQWPPQFQYGGFPMSHSVDECAPLQQQQMMMGMRPQFTSPQGVTSQSERKLSPAGRKSASPGASSQMQAGAEAAGAEEDERHRRHVRMQALMKEYEELRRQEEEDGVAMSSSYYPRPYTPTPGLRHPMTPWEPQLRNVTPSRLGDVFTQPFGMAQFMDSGFAPPFSTPPPDFSSPSGSTSLGMRGANTGRTPPRATSSRRKGSKPESLSSSGDGSGSMAWKGSESAASQGSEGDPEVTFGPVKTQPPLSEMTFAPQQTMVPKTRGTTMNIPIAPHPQFLTALYAGPIEKLTPELETAPGHAVTTETTRETTTTGPHTKQVVETVRKFLTLPNGQTYRYESSYLIS